MKYISKIQKQLAFEFEKSSIKLKKNKTKNMLKTNFESQKLTENFEKSFESNILFSERIKYLSHSTHVDYLDNILNQKEANKHYSIYLDLIDLRENNLVLYQNLCKNPSKENLQWNTAADFLLKKHMKTRQNFLENHACAKKYLHVRFLNHPKTEQGYPNYKACGRLMQIKGIVNNIRCKKYAEHKTESVLSSVKGQFAMSNKSPKTKIFDSEVKSHSNENIKMKYAHFTQEVMLEEQTEYSHQPMYITLILQDDLVDTLELGEGVLAVGFLENRYIQDNNDTENEFVFIVNSLSQMEDKTDKLSTEDLFITKNNWYDLLDQKGEFGARDFLVDSFDPDIYGMNLPKLLIMLSLASCGKNDSNRSQSHVLLVGAPGIAKSNLLVTAVKLSPKGFFGGGYRVSTAGLTAGVSYLDGEKNYEIGILPQCDGGICCIDEFNHMAEDDKSAIHEAMEQQTVHVAKAGVVLNLQSRCAIIAACNPLNLMSFIKNDDSNLINFGIKPALLSRFDVVFVLRDKRRHEFYEKIAKLVSMKEFDGSEYKKYWNTEKLKKHFLVARQFNPKFKIEAENILKQYFRLLYSDSKVDSSRITVRCLEALYRLCKAYARLLFKEEINELDVLVIICLIMENSYSMGQFCNKPHDLVEMQLPLGPTENECYEILKKIGLTEYYTNVLKLMKAASSSSNHQNECVSQKPNISRELKSNKFTDFETSPQINVEDDNLYEICLKELEVVSDTNRKKVYVENIKLNNRDEDNTLDILANEIYGINNQNIQPFSYTVSEHQTIKRMSFYDRLSKFEISNQHKSGINSFETSLKTSNETTKPDSPKNIRKKFDNQNDELVDMNVDIILSDIRLSFGIDGESKKINTSKTDTDSRKSLNQDKSSYGQKQNDISHLEGLIDESFFEDD
uniref:DNA helicase n=1 Tax=Culicoides sonorensis TaxID=179676 RepID=A0A336LU74_CULSO